MKTPSEILAEIDRQLVKVNGIPSDEYFTGISDTLNNLKQFIISEPEKCEHEWTVWDISQTPWKDVCGKCGALK